MRLLLSGRLLAIIAALLLQVPAFGGEESRDFTVVLLPDTQLYSQGFPETYLAQTRWIVREADARNIKFVIHLGDIVEEYDDEQQWRVADRAHRVLDGAVAYSVLPGNHDMSKERDSTLYNKYFSPVRFEKCPWYGGSMDRTNDDNYCFFEAAGMKFMVLSLEYRPTDPMLEWAAAVLTRHPAHRVILATHRYMGPTGRTDTGDRLWEKLVRKHPGVFLVVSGHHMEVAHRTSVNAAGRQVHEILCDYQGRPRGGDGWLQTLRFLPAQDKIRVEAYSPVLDRCNPEPEHTYTLPYPMSASRSKRAG
jgi:hypothetical protein